jgi:hypothetical protein
MKRAMLAFAVGVLISLAGCIDYQETITLADDGSGTIKIRYALDKQFMDEAEQWEDSTKDETYEGSDEIPSEAEIRERIESTGSSVKLLSYEESENEKWRIWDMEFSFGDLADFDRLGKAISEEESAESGTEPERSYSRQPDGTWLFVHRFGGGGESWESGDVDHEMPSDSEFAEAMRQMEEEMREYSEDDEGSEPPDDSAGFDDVMKELAEGMEMMFSGAAEAKMTLTVRFPGKIIESNATRVEGNTAIWESSMFDAPPKMTAKVEH